MKRIPEKCPSNDWCELESVLCPHYPECYKKQIEEALYDCARND